MMMKFFNRLAAFCIFIALTGCGADTDKTSTIPIAEVPEIELELAYTFSEGDILFERLGNAHIIDDEYIVFSVNGPDLHSFTLDGQHVQQVTRQGRGPGEIVRNMNVKTDPNGNLFIASGFGYINFDYTGNGRFELKGNQTFGPNQVGFPMDFYPTPDGDFIVNIATFPPMEGLNDHRNVFALYSSDGEVIQDTIVAKTRLGFEMMEMVLGTGAWEIPYAAKEFIRVSKTGELYKVTSNAFSFDVYNPDGSLNRSFTHPHIEPVQLTTELKNESMEASSIKNVSQIRPLIPDHTPAYMLFYLGDNNTLLLRVETTEGDRLILLDENDGIIGQIKEDFRVMAFDGEHIFRRITNEDETISLQVFRIVL